MCDAECRRRGGGSHLTLPFIPFLIAFSTCAGETKMERLGERKKRVFRCRSNGNKREGVITGDGERANEAESELNLKENEGEGARS